MILLDKIAPIKVIQKPLPARDTHFSLYNLL
jgi:hypothetical protein